jgi:hypothetical protein
MLTACNAYALHETYDVAFPQGKFIRQGVIIKEIDPRHRNPMFAKVAGWALVVLSGFVQTGSLWWSPSAVLFPAEYGRWEARKAADPLKTKFYIDMMVMLIASRNFAPAVLAIFAHRKDGEQLRFWSAFWIVRAATDLQDGAGIFQYESDNTKKQWGIALMAVTLIVDIIALAQVQRTMSSDSDQKEILPKPDLGRLGRSSKKA